MPRPGLPQPRYSPASPVEDGEEADLPTGDWRRTQTAGGPSVLPSPSSAQSTSRASIWKRCLPWTSVQSDAETMNLAARVIFCSVFTAVLVIPLVFSSIKQSNTDREANGQEKQKYAVASLVLNCLFVAIPICGLVGALWRRPWLLYFHSIGCFVFGALYGLLGFLWVLLLVSKLLLQSEHSPREFPMGGSRAESLFWIWGIFGAVCFFGIATFSCFLAQWSSRLSSKIVEEEKARWVGVHPNLTRMASEAARIGSSRELGVGGAGGERGRTYVPPAAPSLASGELSGLRERMVEGSEGGGEDEKGDLEGRGVKDGGACGDDDTVAPEFGQMRPVPAGVETRGSVTTMGSLVDSRGATLRDAEREGESRRKRSDDVPMVWV
uniref:Uncharacterized protein n=1 Tax=Chromera velia CCMP2878 TaxID=1169474 RepID=A0A0G4FYQ1_9ALVE|eukprot:Cvel_3921.t1-p1 / transcript=Cvel_3921.t1 / gene=Cvel_3921 / organism=Chromera_velia_CCMP2878 / gene_product=hypothetical protein / transcript_product=hypothetical protein / location=Cvel_scaffold166:78720-81355(-) / protein_length=380 / sequence_SO=supercontig / SO=protein_coding / is_pseudo=false